MFEGVTVNLVAFALHDVQMYREKRIASFERRGSGEYAYAYLGVSMCPLVVWCGAGLWRVGEVGSVRGRACFRG